MTQREQVTLVEAARLLEVPLGTVKSWAKPGRARIHRANYIRDRRGLVAVYDLAEVRLVAEQWRARDTPKRTGIEG